MKFVAGLFIVLMGIGKSVANEADHLIIMSIIEDFKSSIQNKDTEGYLSLFLDPSFPMVASVTDKGLEFRRQFTEQYNKEHNKNLAVSRNWKVTPEQAAKRKTQSEDRNQQEIFNVKIQTDSNIANVYFDYNFYVNGEKSNWGEESWNMVKTVEGWKIVSIVYSVDSIWKENGS